MDVPFFAVVIVDCMLKTSGIYFLFLKKLQWSTDFEKIRDQKII